MDFTQTKQLSTQAVAARDADIRILDVRSETEWKTGHIQDADHMPLGELWDRKDELPLDAGIIAVCGSGYRSSIAASLLQMTGFGNIRSMSGGMKAWNQRRLPTIATS
jgi:hydroxyacylglutathione hydrolase